MLCNNMSGKGRLILSALLIATNTFVKAQLGAVETNVPWRAGHASGTR
jgi:hypothetical protein